MKYASKLMVVPYVPHIQSKEEHILHNIDEKRNQIIDNPNLSTSDKLKIYNQYSLKYKENLEKFNQNNKYEPNFIDILTSQIVDKTYEKIKPELDKKATISVIKPENVTPEKSFITNNQPKSKIPRINPPSLILNETVHSPILQEQLINDNYNLQMEQPQTSQQQNREIRIIKKATKRSNTNNSTVYVPTKKQFNDETIEVENINMVNKDDDPSKNEDADQSDAEKDDDDNDDNDDEDDDEGNKMEIDTSTSLPNTNDIIVNNKPLQFEYYTFRNKKYLLPKTLANKNQFKSVEKYLGKIPDNLDIKNVKNILKQNDNIKLLNDAWKNGAHTKKHELLLSTYLGIISRSNTITGNGIIKKWVTKKFC